MNPDPTKPLDFRICLTEGGRPYVRSDAVIGQVVRTLNDGHYCAILGHRYGYKTQLLRDVKETLDAAGDRLCILLDLRALVNVSGSDFLKAFAGLVGKEVEDLTGVAMTISDDTVSDGRTLRLFLEECVQAIKKDLVLLINRLDRVHVASLRSFLLTLRAIYSERKADDLYRLDVVTAGTLGMANLALGPSSPFISAHVIWMQDLRPEESTELVGYILGQKKLGISSTALERLMLATKGDRYLIPILTSHCATLASDQRREVTVQDVNEAIDWFLTSQTQTYPAFGDTLLALKADAVALWNVLNILERGRVARDELKILPKEIDNLRLTGAIRAEEGGSQEYFGIRNELCEAYLREKLKVSIVVDVLRPGGLIEEAIDYLESRVAREPELWRKLLATVVDSILVARSESAAYARLARRMPAIFGIPKVTVHAPDGDSQLLQLVAEAGFGERPILDLPLGDTTRPECAAYSSGLEVSQSWNGEQVLAVPLLGTGAEVLAIVAMYGDDADALQDSLELRDFLKCVAHSLQELKSRERELRYFDENWKQVPASLDPHQVAAATIDAAMKAVPAADNGSIFLWNPELERLVLEARLVIEPGGVIAPWKGLPERATSTVQLRKGQGYVGWAYENKQHVLLADATADPRTVVVDPVLELSALCVPLEAWGRVVGVLCLQSVTRKNAFRAQDLRVLYSFRNQAALAIQNARFTTELYELGMRINRGDLDLRHIFQAAVRSIRRVSGSKAANMFLLSGTKNPAICLAEAPLLSISDGFPEGFDEAIRSRSDGLTAQVLQDKQPRFVSDLQCSPGINPLTRGHGIQAYICLPLMIQNLIIGVLFVHYEESHVFSDDEVRKLSLFANQTALAIESAQQREQLTLTDAVVEIGITFSSLAHRISQKVGALNNLEYALRKALLKAHVTDQRVFQMLDEIKEYAGAIGEVSRSPDAKDETINLNEMLLEEVSRWCKASGVKPAFSVTLKPIEVVADRGRLSFLIELLTQNAVRAATSIGSSCLEVHIGICDSGAEVEVRITNPGQPIPIALQCCLFRQRIRTAEGAQGSGVGLVIARRIVEKYGGRIRLVETSAKRTTFEFTLPLHRLETLESDSKEGAEA